jgi:hypothetical protein
MPPPPTSFDLTCTTFQILKFTLFYFPLNQLKEVTIISERERERERKNLGFVDGIKTNENETNSEKRFGRGIGFQH